MKWRLQKYRPLSSDSQILIRFCSQPWENQNSNIEATFPFLNNCGRDDCNRSVDEMVLKIRMRDLFFGFIHNYWTLGIRYESKHAKWTQRILGYFANLGQMLGVVVEYEWRRYDLVWFYQISDRKDGEPWLHVEHENSASRLSNLYEKVVTSKAPNVIAIGYPASYKEESAFVEKLERFHSMNTEKEVMFILDPAYQAMSGDSEIVAYISRPTLKEMRGYTAKRYKAPDGTYYATWLDEREEAEEDDT